MDNTWLLVPGLIAIVAVSAWLSVIDIREHLLPNRLVGPLAGGVAIWVVVMGLADGDIGRSVAALGWGFAASAVFFVFHLTAGLGMGDVKYAWPVGATLGWFGWGSIKVALVGLAIGGLLVALPGLVQRKGLGHRVAYGPAMAFAMVCGIANGLLV